MINVDKQEAEEGKVLSIFAYIGILFLVPLLAGGDNQFTKFHVNQGLVLFLASLALSVIGSIIGFIHVLGFISWLIFMVDWLGYIILAIIGIINVVQLEAKPLPIIGGITLIKSY